MSQTNKPEERLAYQGYPYAKRITTDVPSSKPEVATRTSRSDHRLPYQGFPYVKPIVTDAPTLNAAELAALAKWQNLPRRQLAPSSRDGKSQVQEPPLTKHEDSPEEPTASSRPYTSKNLDPHRPVVYIDIPEGSSGMSDRRTDQDQDGGRSNDRYGRKPSKPKPDLDLDHPVVYIDIPENGGSEVSQTIEEEQPAYVQETIFFDQFKGRRIELPCDSDSESQGSSGSHGSPNTLNIGSPGSSGFGSASSSLPHSNYSQNYQSKETYLYGQRPTSNDGFTLSPLPVNDFPAYPPPYEEIVHTVSQNPQSPPVTEQPRTQVITNPASPRPLVVADSRRKLLTCQHCNSAVQTLVVTENGFYTHLLACLACIFVFPLVFVVYCTGWFKYRSHYCPACNKKIGKDLSLCCFDHMTYVS